MSIRTRTILASASRTVTGSAVVGLPGDNPDVKFILVVTAVTGTTPTLDVIVEQQAGGVDISTLVTFTQATGVTQEASAVIPLVSDTAKLTWTIGGTTPDFTFAVYAVR